MLYAAFNATPDSRQFKMTSLLPKLMLLVIGLTCSFAASAQSSDPAWLDQLRFQLILEKQCEVRFFLNLREKEEALGMSYSVRVQCDDGRMFDAERDETDTEFTITTCCRAVCQLETEGK